MPLRSCFRFSGFEGDDTPDRRRSMYVIPSPFTKRSISEVYPKYLLHAFALIKVLYHTVLLLLSPFRAGGGGNRAFVSRELS